MFVLGVSCMACRGLVPGMRSADDRLSIVDRADPPLAAGRREPIIAAMSFSPAPHVTQNWQLTKPAASGRRGMVVAQAKSAAEAGVAVLDAGGNAVDAALATALALAAVEPWNSGLEGIDDAVIPSGRSG